MSRDGPRGFPRASLDLHPRAPCLSLNIINTKALVCDEEGRDFSERTGTVLHDLPFRKPDEGPRAERPLVRHEIAFENIQAVAARMGVAGIDEARGVANQPNLCPGLRVGVEILAENRPPKLFSDGTIPRRTDMFRLVIARCRAQIDPQQGLQASVPVSE